ncbi:APC family permease [Methylococcus geothermalis]|uniref:Amino acid permease n=1 Tax=Methylococcus geothermalis TaxID=2681310 RepID=A0A858QC14_9GAMM|nr:APC family permease [Methylococcus geothermalis]QJD31311.1 amino acid permease [Methylococcus geothermalis]
MQEARRFGLPSATLLVVASMVGSGVFTTGGFLLEALKSPWLVLLAWLCGGAIAACGALSYGALARRFPESGGEYLFLSRTLHPAAGNVAGWISLLVGFSAPMAAAAYGFGEYLAPWTPWHTPQLTGTLLLGAFALLHGVHGPAGAWVQNFAVVFKLALMAGFVLLAWPRLAIETFPAGQSEGVGFGAFFSSLIWVSFSYSGWNAAVYLGGEVRDPERALPLALLLGTGLVTALYLALNTAFMFSAEVDTLAGKADIGRVAAFALGGIVWADFLTLLVGLALSLSVSAMMMAGPRVYACMARDGFLPRWFSVHESGAPRRATFLQCALSLALLWSAGFKALLTYTGFTLGLSTAATVCGLIRLRLKEGGACPVIGWPWAPLLYLLAVIAMTVAASIRQPQAASWGLATIPAVWLLWRIGARGMGKKRSAVR